MLKIYDLKTEYKTNPIDIDEVNPTFSWKLFSDDKSVKQDSYQIIVRKENRIVYDSGIVYSDQSLYHTYKGERLTSQTRYVVDVCVKDNYGHEEEISGYFETALSDTDEFKASFITHGFEDELEAPAIFMHSFKLKDDIASARLYATALGVYKVELNGKRVEDYRLSPGWTSYQERLQYQTYDITDYLNIDNDINITVANGYWKGILGFYNQGCHYGKRTALMAQIVVKYKDGSTEIICSDENWKSTTGPIRYSELYHGEIIDLTYKSEDIRPVNIYEYPKKNLVAQINDPVRIVERVKVKELIHSPSGAIILDFGQNMSAVVETKLHLPKGTKITLKHGEMLDENNEMFTRNLRFAKATDTFICSGEDDIFLPEFTCHGFRYVEVEGIDEVNPDWFTACVIHTDFERNNSFSCSNEDINRLWKNIDWTMRSNYIDIPMDCPQRDERLGYTGDAQIFLPTALFHGNLSSFYRKWLRDLKVEQSDEFGVPLTVPDILRTHACVNIWHDAAAIVPWLIYQTYGDKNVLSEQYESILNSVEYTRRLAGDYGLLQIDNSSQFGDWLALDYPKGPFRKIPEGELRPSMDEKGGGTDLYLIGNVYYLYSIDILRKVAKILDKQDDVKEYDRLYEDVLDKFRKEYISENGRVVSQSQTAAALIIYFDLAKEKDRNKILNTLILNLIKTKKHLSTGFVGTQYLPHVLSKFNKHQLMGDILLKDDCPSWLYEVKLGATTIWELWDGVNPDHSINLFAMNSFNQYGFGTIGDWLIKELAGIKPLEPGYKKSSISPKLIKGIDEVKASYETPYGKLSVYLSCKNGRIIADIEIPVNTSCLLTLPEKDTEEYGSGNYHFEYDTDLSYKLEKYSEDNTLRQLLAVPMAKNYFEQKAPDIANNAFVNNFAGRLSIIEIKNTIPKSMIPESVYPIFDEMIDLLNKEDKE